VSSQLLPLHGAGDAAVASRASCFTAVSIVYVAFLLSPLLVSIAALCYDFTRPHGKVPKVIHFVTSFRSISLPSRPHHVSETCPRKSIRETLVFYILTQRSGRYSFNYFLQGLWLMLTSRLVRISNSDMRIPVPILPWCRGRLRAGFFLRQAGFCLVVPRPLPAF
jgi:hypothetical protein